MKYYLIAGEASGDLHASHLMAALKQEDSSADFRFLGGDLMSAVGGTLVKHYREMAYMGFIPVLLHLRTIFGNMKHCKEDIRSWRPDVVILVDYPGFNLDIAQFVHGLGIPVFYYIAPKIWAWKEYRIRNIRRDVNELFSILPFEIDFFEHKHHYPIHYVGNPTLDEVTSFLQHHPYDGEAFRADLGLDERPIIALLAGSRKQEIKDNLPRMIKAAEAYADYQIVVAGAPSVPESYYANVLKRSDVHITFGQTYRLLQHAEAALVTSGTATLETALFGVPQVVCYAMKAGKMVSLLRKMILKVRYVSLVNLIADYDVVPELVAGDLTDDSLKKQFQLVLEDDVVRKKMLEGYARVRSRLGELGAPVRAARSMMDLLNSKYDKR